jgi:DNA replication and repair protein RecF
LAECSLALRRLSLSHFRNYRSYRLELENEAPSIAILLGPNGSGKTNFLEAVSYLAPGRGLRGARLADVTHMKELIPWAVAATLVTLHGLIEVGTGLTPPPPRVRGHTLAEATQGAADGPASKPVSANRRQVRIDGLPASGPAALGEYVSVAWLTPKMDRLFKEGASGRRRFFDRLALGLHPDHGKQLAAYERTMRERLRLLNRRERSAEPNWLTALERKISESGVAIAAARIDTLVHLQEQIDRSAEGAFPKADLKLGGLLESWLVDCPAIEVEDAFAIRLYENRALDAEIGRQSTGTHRSDLEVHHRMKAIPAAMCSTGEQKALLINMVLADARMQHQIRGAGPILLLDEVAAHLDDLRRRALFEELLSLNSQIWLTGTDGGLFEALEGQAAFYGAGENKLKLLAAGRQI